MRIRWLVPRVCVAHFWWLFQFYLLLVLSTRSVMAIIMVSFRHKSRYSVASLISARLIPDIVCISSIHLFLEQAVLSCSLTARFRFTVLNFAN